MGALFDLLDQQERSRFERHYAAQVLAGIAQSPMIGLKVRSLAECLGDEPEDKRTGPEIVRDLKARLREGQKRRKEG